MTELLFKPGFYFQLYPVSSKITAPQVRSLLYKLRLTWGDRYQVFTDQKLYQLDKKIKTFDPAWPVRELKPSRPVPVPAAPPGTKIHVNPAFVGKVGQIN